MTTTTAVAQPASAIATARTASSTRCKSLTASATTCPSQEHPWGNDQRATAKTAIFAYVTRNSRRDAFPILVDEVFDGAVDGGHPDYQLAYRFVTAEYSDFFEIESLDGCLWVSPTPAALHLTAVKERVGTHDGDDVACKADAKTGNDADSRRYARDHVRADLEKWSFIESDSIRQSFANAFVRERASLEDRHVLLARERGAESNYPEFILGDYSTRFTDPSYAIKWHDRMDEAFDQAADRHTCALMITLTTDPANFDSILDAADALLGNKNDLMRKLAYENDGSRPDHICVPEFTESGLPHCHIVVFGLSRYYQPSLSAYMADKQGRIVWCSPLESRGSNEWYVVSSLDDDQPNFGPGSPGEPRSVRTYITKMFKTFQKTASRSATELKRDLDDGSWRDWWQLALYWATGMRAWTRSQALQTSAPATDPVTHYRRVGVACYDEFPQYVTDRATCANRLRSRCPLPPDSTRVRGTDPPPARCSSGASSADRPAVAPTSLGASHQ